MLHFTAQPHNSNVTNDRSCGKAEVGKGPGNGNLPLETFRLVSPNITKHLTARIRSEAEVHIISLKVRNVLSSDLYGSGPDRLFIPITSMVIIRVIFGVRTDDPLLETR